MTSWFLTYKHPMAPPGAISIVVSPEHGGLMRVTGPMFGVDLPGRPEIGKYKHPLAADEVTKLKNLTSEAVEEASATKGKPVLPGTRFLSFGLRDMANHVDKSASFPMTKPFPPAVKKLDNAMLSLAKRLSDHPFATLKGIGSCKAATVDPKQDLELLLTLHNSGPSPIRIHNPAAADSDARVGLEILIEKDLPEERLEEGDSKYIPVKKGEVAQVKAPGSDQGGEAQPIVSLGSRQEIVLSVKIRRHLYLGSATYRVSMTYTGSTKDIPEEEAVEGYMKVPAGKFSVKARR